MQASALGGPVILGGDDQNDHGSFDPTAGNQNGWLYMQRALENIKAKVRRANDNSVAALGSSEAGGDAGEAINRAATAAGLTVSYHNGGPTIELFFTNLRASLVRPAIIWIPGNETGNDLDEPAEVAALTQNATAIADFVNSGGGLLSHGEEYGWLFALLPGATSVISGSVNDLRLTPEGMAAFPGLTDTELNTNFWHNHFEGDLGGLQVLVRSLDVKDAAGNFAAVVIGGSSVQLPGSIALEPSSAESAVGAAHTVTATVRNNAGALQSGVQVTFQVTAGPNAGLTATATSDANGRASFSWNGSGGPGEDAVTASFTDSSGNVQSASAAMRWIGAPPPVEPATSSVAGIDLVRGRLPLVPATGVAPVRDISSALGEHSAGLPVTGLNLGALSALAAMLIACGSALVATGRWSESQGKPWGIAGGVRATL